MLIYPDINRVALDLGAHNLPLIGEIHPQIHWYGLMYLFGFMGSWWLGIRRARNPDNDWTRQHVEDLIFFGALGVVLGGRLGYTLFYNFSGLIENPISLFYIWQGGMSFHGGMLGVFTALYIYGRKNGMTFFQVSDFIAPWVPIGLGAGRLGNFINKELPGRPVESSISWAMDYGDHIARHPSSLYQALTEGLLLFLILYFYSSKPRPRYAVSALFMIGYGSFRFITEFFRTPDAHIGFVAFDWMTKGQQLSIPMVLFGFYLVYLIRKKNTSQEN
jgi:phosphatidylglycerol:prolipoprotein diacylglycerol transferase